MKFSALKNKGFLIVASLFLIICLIKIYLTLPFPTPFIMMDETYYDNVAQNVLHGKLYSTFLSQFGTTPPGYSIFLSIAYLFMQDKATTYHIELAINAILTTSIIFPSYFILKKYCSQDIAVLGALVVATLPVVNLFPFMLLSENLFIPLFVYSVWFLIESYETNNHIWEILASLLVVFIYMTRSTGISMLIGFVAAFGYYAFVNRKEKSLFNIIKEKKVLLLSFIIFLSLWLTYTSFCIPHGSYSIGSPYHAETIYTQRISSALLNLDILIDFLIPFIREMDYLLVSTYFTLIFLIYFYVRSFMKREGIKGPIHVSFIYFVVSSMGLLVISTTFLSTIYTKITFEVYGRYIEAIVPLVFLFAIIGLYKFCEGSNYSIKKWIASLFIILPIVIFALFSLPVKNYNIAHTLSIYYLYAIYNQNLTNILLIIFALMLFVLIYLITFDKRFFYIFLLSLICFSILFSVPTYRLELLCSDSSTSDILNYLQKIPNTDNIVLMDNSNSGIGWYLYSQVLYWGNNIYYADIDTNSSLHVEYNNKTIYIISQNNYPYKIVANDNMNHKLYLY